MVNSPMNGVYFGVFCLYDNDVYSNLERDQQFLELVTHEQRKLKEGRSGYYQP